MESEKSRPLVARWRDAVLSADGPPKPMTRLVLLALGKYMASTGGECWPSVDTLATDTGTSRRTVCTHIATAQSLGWVRVVEKKGAGQAWRRHQYQALNPLEGSEGHSQPCPEGSERDSQPLHEGGEPRAPKVVKFVREGGEPPSHEQAIEQDKEQEGAAQGGRRRSRAKQLPKSFEPDSTCRAKAEMLGLDLGAELETFTNHAQAHGRTVKDWQAAFRNWLIKANQFGRGQQNTKPSQRRVSPSDHRLESFE